VTSRLDLPRLASTLARWRGDFRRWRRGRPFWSGLFLILAGIEMLISANMDFGGLEVHLGVEGFLSYLLPALMVLCGIFVWVTPNQRIFYGIVGTLTAVYSLMGLNLGGWFLGMLLGIIGGALAFAWTPVQSARHARDDDATPASGGGAPARRSFRLFAIAVPALLLVSAMGLAPSPVAKASSNGTPGAAPLASAPTIAAAAGQPLVSGKPGKLTTSRLTLEGFAFDGVVILPTATGSIRTLRFSLNLATNQDFQLLIDVSGRTQAITADPLVVSGNVLLYTSRFSGRLLGIPLTFTPDFPPPLTLPRMVFTDVSLDLVFLDCPLLRGHGLVERAI
jgi:Family of unknown function (DUF6114)